MVLRVSLSRRLLRRNRASSAAAFRTRLALLLDHVELVRISGNDFRDMVARFPSVRTGLEAVPPSAARQISSACKWFTTSHRSIPLARLMEAQSLLILDLQNCTRCDACVNACADAHDGSRGLIRDGLRFDQYLVATSCRQCRDRCACWLPVGSIRRRNSLEVIIEDWCIGCGLCAQNFLTATSICIHSK